MSPAHTLLITRLDPAQQAGEKPLSQKPPFPWLSALPGRDLFNRIGKLIHCVFLLAGAVAVLSILNWGRLDISTALSHSRTTHDSFTLSELMFKLLTQKEKQGILFGGRAGL